MILGVFFKLDKTSDLFFKYLFYNIDLSKYIINIDDAQVWKDNLGNDTFVKSDYQGETFQNIAFQSQYLITQLKLKAFCKFPKKIKEFNDYLNSDCEFMIYIYDCFYIEIYCKSNMLLNLFINNIKEHFLFVDLELISQEEINSNQGRRDF